MQRVEVLELANSALLNGKLDEDLRQRAEREAHALAGSLGTFGFSHGALLARELEQFYQASTPLSEADAEHLDDLVVALKHELQQPPGHPGDGSAVMRGRIG